MKQFDINRFCRLARWTLGNERSYYVKAFFQYYVIFTAMFLLLSFTAEDIQLLKMGTVIFVIGLAVIVCMGGSYMFISMTGKHDLQRLLLLPASNLEKFLMRYLLSFLSQLVICIGCILIADLVQYVVGWIIGRSETCFFIPVMCDILSRFDNIPGPMVWCLFTQFLWVHTFYIVGANFFRNIKFSWLFTSIVLFVLFLAGIYLLNSFVENGRQVTLYMENHTWQFSFLFLALSIFHVWLAYRLFCRRQLVGRFFNC